MCHQSRIALVFVGLALLALAPTCDKKTTAEQQKREADAKQQQREAEARAERERQGREEAERGRATAEKEAAQWKIYCGISLVATLLVLAVWTFSSTSSTPNGSTPPTQLSPLKRLSVALLTAVITPLGGLLGGFLFGEIGAIVASLSIAILTVASSHSTPTVAG